MGSSSEVFLRRSLIKPPIGWVPPVWHDQGELGHRVLALDVTEDLLSFVLRHEVVYDEGRTLFVFIARKILLVEGGHCFICRVWGGEADEAEASAFFGPSELTAYLCD